MTSKSLWLIGLVLVLAASFLNGILISQNIGGLLRESARFVILIGIFILALGLILQFKKK
jgi:hypothetical protein